MLDGMADRMEGKAPEGKDNLEHLFERLEQTVRTCCSEEPQQLLTGGTADFSCYVPQDRKLDDFVGQGDLITEIVEPSEANSPMRSLDFAVAGVELEERHRICA